MVVNIVSVSTLKESELCKVTFAFLGARQLSFLTIFQSVFEDMMTVPLDNILPLELKTSLTHLTIYCNHSVLAQKLVMWIQNDDIAEGIHLYKSRRLVLSSFGVEASCWEVGYSADWTSYSSQFIFS